MLSLITVGLTSAILTSSSSGADQPTRFMDAAVDQIERLENGSAAADYFLCWMIEQNNQSPYYRSVAPSALFDGFGRASIEIDRLAASYSGLTPDTLENAVFEKLEDRGLSRACGYILIPDSQYLRRVADAAEYRVNAERNLVDPEQDFRALVDEHLERLQALPNGRTVVSAGACQHRYESTFGMQDVRLANVSSNPDGLQTSLDRFLAAQASFNMSRHLFDEDAIWTAAYDTRVPSMTQSECENLLAPYIAN